MTEKRFNALAILHLHKDIVDKLSLVVIGNDFVDDEIILERFQTLTYTIVYSETTFSKN